MQALNLRSRTDKFTRPYEIRKNTSWKAWKILSREYSRAYAAKKTIIKIANESALSRIA